MDISKELNELGKSIVADAKKLARPNKKTGKLESSIDYTVEGDSVSISEESYGKFLNKKTKFMNKAVDKNLDKSIDKIANSIADNIMEELTKDLNKKL